MKNRFILVLLTAVLSAGFYACGDGEAEKKAAEEKEVQTLDSLNHVADSVKQVVETNKENLSNTLNQLKQLEENKK